MEWVFYKKIKKIKGLIFFIQANMSNLELISNMLAEATTTEISKEKMPTNLLRTGLLQNKEVQLLETPAKK